MVACYSVAGRTTERAGRNHHRRIRVSLVGTADERTGDLHGRRNTRNLRERLTQPTTNKVSIPYSLLLDRNFVFQKFDTATIPKSGTRSLRFQNMFFTFVDDILKFTEA